MLNSVNGILTYKGSDIVRVESASGLEWELSVPSRSVDSFGNIGDKTKVLCWMLHREDSMQLFGFQNEEERVVFLELLTVSGIGPKAAIRILSSIASKDLEEALENEDMGKLEAIPGLGKKTAQKLVFSLKGKLPSKLKKSTNNEEEGQYKDIVNILVNMGYDKRRATEVLKNLSDKNDLPLKSSDRESELVRRAIVELSS